MILAFYTAAAVALLSTVLVVTRLHAVHALLYLIVSLLSVAVVFLVLGAPFAAALEVIVYAGAIMVLFLFAVMILDLGSAVEQERAWLDGRMWVGPGLLSLVLLLEVVWLVSAGAGAGAVLDGAVVGPRAVGRSLYGPYLLGVELAGMLLLAGLVGAYHLGRRTDEPTAGTAGAKESAAAGEGGAS